MMKPQFSVVSMNHVVAQVLLKHFGDDGKEIKRETRHIAWNSAERAWKDKQGHRYNIPAPEEPVLTEKREVREHKSEKNSSPVTPRLIRLLGPGEGVFEITGRHFRLVQVRGDQWRLAQGNKFFSNVRA